MGCPENLVIVATRLLVGEVGPWLLSAADVLFDRIIVDIPDVIRTRERLYNLTKKASIATDRREGSCTIAADRNSMYSNSHASL